MNKNEAIFTILITAFSILLVSVCFLIVPFSQIWAVNTLFGSLIEYSLKNWVAVVILNLCFRLWLVPNVTKK
jgi:hypothetical protein